MTHCCVAKTSLVGCHNDYLDLKIGGYNVGYDGYVGKTSLWNLNYSKTIFSTIVYSDKCRWWTG